MSEDMQDDRNGSKIPTGYRSSRRGSKSLKSAKRAERADRLVTGWTRFWAAVRRLGYALAVLIGGALALVIVALLLASLVNGIARWSREHRAARGAQQASAGSTETSENVLIIGQDGGRVAGFLAVRIDSQGKQVYGIAIPDGAFLEVPGQGFEKVGDSFAAGPDVSMSAVSNYLLVPFTSYATVSAQTYRDALKAQDLRSITASITGTNLTDAQRAQLSATLAAIPAKNTALVPLPTKPIKLGNQTYFEPQRDEVADLLKAWWGIDASATAQVTRVIVYNGAGKPGIAGAAAQELIRGGFRVIDTKNADRFDYKTTQVVVQRGPVEKGAEIVKALGTGEVSEKRTDEDVVDIIVIVGSDYRPTR